MEKNIEIMHLLARYASHVAQTVQYKSWSDEFCRKEINDYTDGFLAAMKKHINWDNLRKEEALGLGFTLWSEEYPDLYLIPLYLFPILPIGTEVTCIDGRTFTYDGTNMDNDVRFGCIAYGITIKE